MIAVGLRAIQSILENAVGSILAQGLLYQLMKMGIT